MIKYIEIFIFVSIFASCKRYHNEYDKTVVDNSIKSGELLSFDNCLVDTDLFDKFTIIPLETNNDNLFKKIDRITINNERIYLFDNNTEQILIFDIKGKYINTIHQIGQGPGEYISIMDFCLDEKNKEILLLCDVPYKLMKYSLEGKFISDITFSNLYGELSMDSGNIYCVLNEAKDKYELGCFDENMKSKFKGLSVRRGINVDCYYSGKSLVKSNKLIYTRRFDPALYYVSCDCIEKKIVFNFGKYQVTDDLQYEKDCYKLFQAAKNKDCIYSITNVVESDRYIIFTTNLGLCVYMKETNELKGYNMIHNSNLNMGNNIYYPNEGDKNTIITSFEPASLAYYDDKAIESNSILRDLMKKVKYDDNPILIVYRFK